MTSSEELGVTIVDEMVGITGESSVVLKLELEDGKPVPEGIPLVPIDDGIPPVLEATPDVPVPATAELDFEP